MENLLLGGVKELETVKQAMKDLETQEQQCKDTDKSLKAKQKELELQKKRVEEKINSAVKKSRTELEKGFDEQLGSAEKAIKEAENKKKDAKSAAINLRMKRENSSLIDENKTLLADVSARFKEDGVPSICKSRIYYALFEPKENLDFLFCAIGILIFAGIIPFLITRLASTTFLAVLLWIFLVVFFAAIYLLLSVWTKKGVRHETILRSRPSVERIADNKKFIKKRNKNIKADPDERQYNLMSYDQEIERTKAEYDEVNARKEDAIRNFEEVDSIAIRDRMQQENNAAIQALETEYNQMLADYTNKSQLREDTQKTVSEYIASLGDKFNKTEKIDELIAAFENENVTTVEQAIESLNQKGK